MRPPPTTAEILAHRALRHPGQPALREGDTELDYAALANAVGQCALELQRLGLRAGERVAVAGPGFGVQLALLLAAEGLGALTASFQPENDPDAAALFGHVDRVFAAVPQAVPEGVHFHLLDAAFVARLAQPLHASPPWAAAPLAAPQRITRTSGSSGRSKLMVLSRAALEWWIRLAGEWEGSGPGDRLLMLGPLVMTTAFARCSACLRGGGMVLAGAPAQVAGLAPTHVWGLPLQLEEWLAGLPQGWTPAAPVQVVTNGGLANEGLRQRLQARLGGQVTSRYGCNEAGPICDAMDAAGVGTLVAGVDLRVLGPDGADLPAGQEGVLAVRTPGMPEGYLDRPEETAACFRDGWFVGSDVGALVGPRRLRLAGRRDDLVNIGGLKVPAAQLEGQLRALPAFAEAAVLEVHLAGGSVTLGVAAVLEPGARVEEARAQLAEGLRLPVTAGVQLLVLEKLPVLASGKLDRMGLLRRFRGG